jgi:branched-chain amino acid transport system ATP-binding protein
MLSVKNVRVQFGGLRAVDDVSFDVAEGEIVGLIGPNGAGKTTLFQAISGFVKPAAGEVHFLGSRIDGLNGTRICHAGLARTFQIVEVFPSLTVMETLIAAAHCKLASSAAREMAVRCMERVGLQDKRDRYCRDLPLLDQKALEIGKALATQPRMILLDEVMAGLRPSETGRVIELIESARRSGITFLMVEHLMEVIMRISDRIVVVASGRKIAEGLPKDIVRNEEVISVYLGQDFSLA